MLLANFERKFELAYTISAELTNPHSFISKRKHACSSVGIVWKQCKNDTVGRTICGSGGPVVAAIRSPPGPSLARQAHEFLLFLVVIITVCMIHCNASNYVRSQQQQVLAESAVHPELRTGVPSSYHANSMMIF